MLCWANWRQYKFARRFVDDLKCNVMNEKLSFFLGNKSCKTKCKQSIMFSRMAHIIILCLTAYYATLKPTRPLKLNITIFGIIFLPPSFFLNENFHLGGNRETHLFCRLALYRHCCYNFFYLMFCLPRGPVVLGVSGGNSYSINELYMF